MQDFWFYLKIGWEHIMSWDALDHQLFIAVLSVIYLLKEWKKVLVLVTAFTIGHSVTLALSVLDVFRFPDKWVEFLIPCTIFITAFSNLFQKEFSSRSVRINYFLALFFGLIHGMGFANTIRMMLASDQSIGTGLLAFNIGLELGQLVVVAILMIFSHFILNTFKVTRREWVIFLSAGVFSIALKMAFERFPY